MSKQKDREDQTPVAPPTPEVPAAMTTMAYGMPPMRAERPAGASAPVPYDGPMVAPAYGMPPMFDSPRLPEARVREPRSRMTIAIVVAAAVLAIVAALLFFPW